MALASDRYVEKLAYSHGKTVFNPLYPTLLLFAISIASYHVIEQTTRRRPNIIFPIFVCFVTTITLRNYYTEGGITKFYDKEIPEVVILGDSHALDVVRILDEIVKELNVSISFYAAYGTPTFFSIPIKKIFEKETPFFSAEERYLFDKMRLRF